MDGSEWLAAQRQRMVASPLPGYAAGEPVSAEPVAVAGLAAITHGWREPALASVRRLCQSQNADGSIGIQLDQHGPYWATSLAVLTWRRYLIAWPQSPQRGEFQAAEERAIEYLLATQGERIDPNESIGHDTLLVGWPWVLGTHSWVEPTAFAVLALRHAGLANHPRTQEACRLLADRWLPEGGANYGNTFVLGQQLRPHVLPSALSGLAMSDCRPPPKGLSVTLQYLRDELKQPLGAVSLGWTVLALLAERPAAEQVLELESAWRQAVEGPRWGPVNDHRLNMLVLAGGMDRSPLLDMPELLLQLTQGG
jgi:hypothetical protein